MSLFFYSAPSVPDHPGAAADRQQDRRRNLRNCALGGRNHDTPPGPWIMSRLFPLNPPRRNIVSSFSRTLLGMLRPNPSLPAPQVAIKVLRSEAELDLGESPCGATYADVCGAMRREVWGWIRRLRCTLRCFPRRAQRTRCLMRTRGASLWCGAIRRGERAGRTRHHDECAGRNLARALRNTDPPARTQPNADPPARLGTDGRRAPAAHCIL